MVSLSLFLSDPISLFKSIEVGIDLLLERLVLVFWRLVFIVVRALLQVMIFHEVGF